ncbi:MAG: MerR family DNA-binding transcriptional regulator [Betaproteobacteria bacterium]|nr:MerR family DNA-binding transcriptional regulator [Betaproteobacteria bacterium]
MSDANEKGEQASAFTISDLAREFSITPRTIRFWEDQGLLAPSREGRNRVYTKRDRTRLKLALRGKRLGLSLAEIRDVICMYDVARDETDQLNRLLNMLAQRRAALEQQREDIEAILGEIGNVEALCRERLVEAEAAEGIASKAGSPAAKSAG